MVVPEIEGSDGSKGEEDVMEVDGTIVGPGQQWQSL